MCNDIKKCKTCGRTITNPKNKTGLCSNCTGKGTVVLMTLGGIVLAVPKAIKFVTKNAPKVLKAGKELIDIIKK